MAEKGKGLYRKTESIYNIKPLGEKIQVNYEISEPVKFDEFIIKN